MPKMNISAREFGKIGQKSSGASRSSLSLVSPVRHALLAASENLLPAATARRMSSACARPGQKDGPRPAAVPHRLFLSGSDGAFERYLGFKAGKILADRRDRQFLAAAAITYRAVACLETALDFRLVPSFGMPYVGNRNIILFGPEEGDGVESFTRPEDIARGRLALPFGDDKMFDSNGFAGEPVRPARDVADRENPGGARLKIFVDRDAAVDGKSCVFRQRGRRPHADADDNKIGFEVFAIFQRDGSRRDRCGGRAEMELYAMLLVKLAKEIAGIRSKNPLHRDRLGRHDIDLDSARAKRCRNFETDEARADHNGPARSLGFGDNSAAVRKRAQIMHMRKIAARYVKPHRFGSCGEEKRIKGQLAAIDEPQLPARCVDSGDTGAKLKIDFMFSLEV